MASAEHEPIMGVWSGGRSPPEAESILVIGCPTEPANLAPVRENSMFCYGPLVLELGGPRVHGASRLRRLCWSLLVKKVPDISITRKCSEVLLLW